EISAAYLSGAIAALLSVRKELIGHPDAVKRLVLDTATDLGRLETYQGRGLINVLKMFGEDGSDEMPGSIKSRVGAADHSLGKYKQPYRLLCSYSHKDEPLWEELKFHLSPLVREGILEVWYDRCLAAGAEWENEIRRKLAEADVVILFISSYFIASDYCYSTELKEAIRQHDSGRTRVVPIIARPTDWSRMPFSKLMALPRDGKPVTSWNDQHEGWTQVAHGIREMLQELELKVKPHPKS